MSYSASHLVQSSRGEKENITTHDHSAAVSAVSAWFLYYFNTKMISQKFQYIIQLIYMPYI